MGSRTLRISSASCRALEKSAAKQKTGVAHKVNATPAELQTRAILGDLHEGMTAIGSPPAAYGESPRWLVQQLLTRSPPFTTGLAHPITARFSLEG